MAFEDATGPDCCCIPNPPCGGIAGRVIGCNPTFGEPPFGEVPLVRGPFTGTAAGPGGRTYRVLINLGGGYQVQVLDDDGFYRGSLPAGDYTITISGPGYFPRTFVVHHVCGTPDNLPVYMHPTVLRFALGAACLGLKDATVTLGGIYSGTASLAAWSYFTGPNYLDVPVSPPGDDPNTLPGCFTATLSMPRYESVSIDICWTTSGLACRNGLSLTTTTECYTCCFPACNYPVTSGWILSTPWGEFTIAEPFGNVISGPPGVPMRLDNCGVPYLFHTCVGATFNGTPPMVVQLLCSGDLASGSDDEFNDPQVSISFQHVCGTTIAGTGDCLPPGSGATVHWDSSACGDSGGGRVASGHIGEDTLGLPFGQVPEDDDLVRFLFGSYGIRESPCAGARMMTFSVDPHAPSTLLDRSGAILGHALADEAGSVVFPRVPETSDPAWLISGEGPPMVVGPPTQGPEGSHS